MRYWLRRASATLAGLGASAALAGALLGLALVGCALVGCAGERAALLRGQAYYEDNQFERALAVWRHLERRQSDLSPSDFARYAYLRGMTDYRLGFHLDARHWLGLARVAYQQHPSALDSAWGQRLDAALADLNQRQLGIGRAQGDAVQAIEAEPGSFPEVPPAPPAPQTPAAPGTEPQAPPRIEPGELPPPAGSSP